MFRSESTSDTTNAELPMKIAMLDNKIVKGNYELANKIPIKISDSEKTTYGNDWCTYQEQNWTRKIMEDRHTR